MCLRAAGQVFAYTHTNANGYSHQGWAGTEQGVLVEVINTVRINQKKGQLVARCGSIRLYSLVFI